LTGEDQLLLRIFLFIYPNALADDLCLVIFANGGGVYSRQVITRRCHELGLTMKSSSREAYAAFSENAIQRLEWFTILPPPLGVANIPIHILIDIDETGFYLRFISTKYGRGHTTCWIHHPAHYTQSQEKVNVILAIEGGNNMFPPGVDGNIYRPRKWIIVSQESCNQFTFGNFVGTILTDIESSPVDGGSDDERIIIWEHLALHKTPYVTTIIEDFPSHNLFHSVDRPPHRLNMAPL